MKNYSAGIYKIYPTKLKKKLNRKTKKPKITYSKFNVKNNTYKEVKDWIFHNKGFLIKNKDLSNLLQLFEKELLFIPDPVNNLEYIIDENDFIPQFVIELERKYPNYKKNYTWVNYTINRIFKKKYSIKKLKKKLKKKCILSILNDPSEVSTALRNSSRLIKDYYKHFFCFRNKIEVFTNKKKKVKTEKKKVKTEKKKKINFIYESDKYETKSKVFNNPSYQEVCNLFNLEYRHFEKIKKKINEKTYKNCFIFKKKNYFKLLHKFRNQVLNNFHFIEENDENNKIWLQELIAKFFYRLTNKDKIFFIIMSKSMSTINRYVHIFYKSKHPKISIYQKKFSFKRFFTNREANFLNTIWFFSFEDFFTTTSINSVLCSTTKKIIIFKNIFFYKNVHQIKNKNFFFWQKKNIKKITFNIFNKKKKKKNNFSIDIKRKTYIIVVITKDIFDRTELEIRKILPLDLFYKEFMTSVTLNYSQEKNFYMFKSNKIINIVQTISKIKKKKSSSKNSRKVIFRAKSDKVFLYKNIIQFQKNIKKYFTFNRVPFKNKKNYIVSEIKKICYFINTNNKIILINSNNIKKELKNVSLSFIIDYDLFFNNNPFITKNIFYINIQTNFKTWFINFYKVFNKLIKNLYFDIKFNDNSFIKFKKKNYNMNDARFVKYRVEKQNFNICSVQFIINYLMLLKTYFTDIRNKHDKNQFFNLSYITFIEKYIAYLTIFIFTYKNIIENNTIFFRNVKSIKKMITKKKKFINFYNKFGYLTKIKFKKDDMRIKIKNIFFNTKKNYSKKHTKKKIYNFYKNDINLFYKKKNNRISKELSFFFNANKVLIKEKFFKKKKTKKKIYYNNKIIKTAFSKYAIQNTNKQTNNIFKMFNNLFFFFQKNKINYNYKNFKKKTVEPTILEGFFFKKKSYIFNRFFVNQHNAITRFDKNFYDLFYKFRRSFKRRKKKKFTKLENSSIIKILNIEKNFEYKKFFKKKKKIAGIYDIRPQASNQYFKKKYFDKWANVFNTIQAINSRRVYYDFEHETTFKDSPFENYIDKISIWKNFQKIYNFTISYKKYRKTNEVFSHIFCDEKKINSRKKKMARKELFFIKKHFEKEQNINKMSIKSKKTYNFEKKKKNFWINTIKKKKNYINPIDRKIKIITFYLADQIWGYIWKNNKSWPWNKDDYTNFNMELKSTKIIFFFWKKIIRNFFSKKKKKIMNDEFIEYIFAIEKKKLIEQYKQNENKKIIIQDINDIIKIENKIKQSVMNEKNFINFFFDRIIPKKYKKLF